MNIADNTRCSLDSVLTDGHIAGCRIAIKNILISGEGPL